MLGFGGVVLQVEELEGTIPPVHGQVFAPHRSLSPNVAGGLLNVSRTTGDVARVAIRRLEAQVLVRPDCAHVPDHQLPRARRAPSSETVPLVVQIHHLELAVHSLYCEMQVRVVDLVYIYIYIYIYI